MTKQTINLGTPPEGKDGDTARSGFTKVNMNFDELYARVQGKLSKDVGGAGTLALTSDEAINGVIDMTGVLTGNRVVTVPPSPAQAWAIRNSTSGAFSLTFQTSTGTGIQLAAGRSTVVFSDGTNIVEPLAVVGSWESVSSPAAERTFRRRGVRTRSSRFRELAALAVGQESPARGSVLRPGQVVPVGTYGTLFRRLRQLRWSLGRPALAFPARTAVMVERRHSGLSQLMVVRAGLLLSRVLT